MFQLFIVTGLSLFKDNGFRSSERDGVDVLSDDKIPMSVLFLQFITVLMRFSGVLSFILEVFTKIQTLQKITFSESQPCILRGMDDKLYSCVELNYFYPSFYVQRRSFNFYNKSFIFTIRDTFLYTILCLDLYKNVYVLR